MSEHDKARDELNEAHAQADPARSGTEKTESDRANVDDVDKGAGVAEKDKKL